MSEFDRTRLYSWMCEHADERLAEYLMACLAPAPLADLVTKDYLTAELSRFATKDDLNTGLNSLRTEMETQRTADRAEMAAQRTEDGAQTTAQRDEDRAQTVAQRDEDRAETAAQFAAMAAQRDEDRRAAQHRHYWQIGTTISMGLSVLTSIWLNSFGVIA